MSEGQLSLAVSDQCGELFAALAKAQSEITAAAKDATNPHFKSKYADLASVWDACRGPLTKNGLCIVQIPSADGNRVSVVTILGHSSGQKITGELTMTARAADPQAVGSVLTYARRYSLSAMVSVAPDDDDGNAGTGKPEEHIAPPRKPEPPKIDATVEPLKNRLRVIGAKNRDDADKIVSWISKGELATLEAAIAVNGKCGELTLKLAQCGKTDSEILAEACK